MLQKGYDDKFWLDQRLFCKNQMIFPKNALNHIQKGPYLRIKNLIRSIQLHVQVQADAYAVSHGASLAKTQVQATVPCLYH